MISVKNGGITSPNLEANPTNQFTGLGYDSTNETLLQTAMLVIFTCRNEQLRSKAMQIAALLLDRGANPNQNTRYNWYDKTKYTFTTHETPLTFSIKSESNEAVNLLFKHSKPNQIHVNEILDNKSSLLLAIEHKNTGLQLLLDHGADPNQTWPGQTNTPLTLAVRENNVEGVQLLLGVTPPADINKPYTNKEGNIVRETPLHIALRQKNPILVQLLIDYGADLSATTLERKKLLLFTTQGYKACTVDEIPTSDACKKLITEARQAQEALLKGSINAPQ